LSLSEQERKESLRERALGEKTHQIDSGVKDKSARIETRVLKGKHRSAGGDGVSGGKEKT